MSKQLIVFSSASCGPCKMYKPVLQDLKDSGKVDDIEILIFDVEESQELAAKYNVRGVPTSVLVDGDNAKTKVGAMSKVQLGAWLDL